MTDLSFNPKWENRFGQELISTGISAVPKLLSLYQIDLGLTTAEINFLYLVYCFQYESTRIEVSFRKLAKIKTNKENHIDSYRLKLKKIAISLEEKGVIELMERVTGGNNLGKENETVSTVTIFDVEPLHKKILKIHKQKELERSLKVRKKRNPATKKLQGAVTETLQPPVTETLQPPVTETLQPPVTNELHSPVTNELHSPVTNELQQQERISTKISQKADLSSENGTKSLSSQRERENFPEEKGKNESEIREDFEKLCFKFYEITKQKIKNVRAKDKKIAVDLLEKHSFKYLLYAIEEHVRKNNKTKITFLSHFEAVSGDYEHAWEQKETNALFETIWKDKLKLEKGSYGYSLLLQMLKSDWLEFREYKSIDLLNEFVDLKIKKKLKLTALRENEEFPGVAMNEHLQEMRNEHVKSAFVMLFKEINYKLEKQE